MSDGRAGNPAVSPAFVRDRREGPDDRASSPGNSRGVDCRCSGPGARQRRRYRADPAEERGRETAGASQGHDGHRDLLGQAGPVPDPGFRRAGRGGRIPRRPAPGCPPADRRGRVAWLHHDDGRRGDDRAVPRRRGRSAGGPVRLRPAGSPGPAAHGPRLAPDRRGLLPRGTPEDQRRGASRGTDRQAAVRGVHGQPALLQPRRAGRLAAPDPQGGGHAASAPRARGSDADPEAS